MVSLASCLFLVFSIGRIEALVPNNGAAAFLSRTTTGSVREERREASVTKRYLSSTPSSPSSPPSSSSSSSASTSSSSTSTTPSTTATTTATTTTTSEYTIINPVAATDEWELDCYSRPVVKEGGKKLWEILITDTAGSFRFCKELPSNQVNSKMVRQVVDDLMESVDIKPTTIRFFRGAMFNMINIALSELPLTAKPSRCVYALAQWLEERHAKFYPTLDGYNRNMITSSTPSFLDVRTPVKLPDALRGEKYAFVALPADEFMAGGGVNAETVGVGRLCPLPPNLPADAFIQGVVVLSARAKALAQWLAGTEVVALTADLRKRSLIMETDIDTQYLLAKLNDQQREEGAALEEGKDALQGLHFICVQEDDDSDPEGFWLLRELPAMI